MLIADYLSCQHSHVFPSYYHDNFGSFLRFVVVIIITTTSSCVKHISSQLAKRKSIRVIHPFINDLVRSAMSQARILSIRELHGLDLSDG